jgi:Ca2+-binding RTX toxin-like protein
VISQSGSDPYTVTDTGNTLTGGGGCTVASGIASCTSTTTITSIRATLLDGIDSIVTNGTTPAVLDGGPGTDTLTGGSGGDTLTGGDGDDALTGGGGSGDVVSYSGAGTGVTVNLSNTGAQSTGGAGTDTILTVEGVTGSSQSDTLTGNGSANSLNGGAGNNDLLNGAGGDDTLDGGDGTGDRVTYFDAIAGVTVTLASSSGQVTGGSGTDILSGFENLTGSGHDDTLTGGAGVNDIVCLLGADTVMAHTADTVAADCESVTRIDGSGGTAPPGTGTGGGGTTAPATPGTTPAATPPVISILVVPRMRSGRPGTFSYSLDKAASVTIAIDQARPGRKDGRTCKKQTRKNRQKRACILFAAIGKLSQPGAAGRNTLRFSGKLGGGKLKPGRYRATAVGTAASGKSAPATANFVVSR